VPLTHRAEIEIKWDRFFVFYNLLEDQGEDPEDFQIIKDRYYVFETQTLGTGSFSTVKLAIDMKSGERMACKIIDKRRMRIGKPSERPAQLSIDQEISILKEVVHPNIVGIKDTVQTSKYVCLFLTRVTGGELFDYILKNSGVQEHESKFIFYQILRAVKYLHSRNITHRDLKPENLLLESAKPFSRVIVTDFGLAKMLPSALERMKTKCGTMSYLAPEVLNAGSATGGYSKCVDCWSLGVLLYVMLAGSLPFGSDEDAGQLMRRIGTADFTFGDECGWDGISWEVKDLISKLLTVDPQKRLTIDEAFAHPWIAAQSDLLAKLYAKVGRRVRCSFCSAVSDVRIFKVCRLLVVG
ncbi:kinase-like domain-containing protein, partial [Blyttiomyces helicus]